MCREDRKAEFYNFLTVADQAVANTTDRTISFGPGGMSEALDFHTIESDEPIRARPVGAAERAWRWCRRKPALAMLGAVVLILLLVVMVGAPIAVIRIDRARAEAETSSVEANSARVEVERSLYSAEMMRASEALRDGAIDQVHELLRRHEPRNGAEDMRGFEWRYLRYAADQSGLMPHELQGLSARLIGLLGWFLSGSFFCHQRSSSRQCSSISSLLGFV
jgi:hypothetical protein